MACCSPVEIFYNVKEQKNQIKYTLGCELKPILVDCGKCPACQQKFTTQLGLRAIHELQAHSEAMFITLTCNDESISEVFPEYGLNHVAFQKFMKRFRRYLDVHYPGTKVRYLMAGEYGAKGGRPHYHAVIYGFRFKDLKVHRRTTNYTTYRSATLEKLWKYGFSEIGEANMKTCSYLAKYVAKGRAKTVDDYTNQFTGEVIKKEYLVYPKGQEGGLGYDFFKKNAKKFFKQGYFLLPSKRGKEPSRIGIPRYYKKKFQEEFPDEYEEYKDRMSSIIQQKEEEYISKKLLGKPTSMEIKVMMLSGFTKKESIEQLEKIYRKEVMPMDVYHQKQEDGRKRRVIYESRADNTRN